MPISPYDDAVDTLATGAAPVQATDVNPYDSLLDDVEATRKTRVAGAVQQALTVNPDQHARQQRIAKALGYPLAAVEAMPTVTAQEAQLRQVQQDVAGHPVLEHRYTDADFAKLAHDDSGALSALAGWFKDVALYVTSHPSAPNTLGGDAVAGVLRANTGAAGVWRGAAEMLAPLLDPLAGTVLPENPLRRVAGEFAAMGASTERKAKEMAPPQPGTVAGGVSSGVQSLVQNLLMLPLAFTPGGAPAALTGMVSMTGGQAYQQAREQGMAPMSAAQLALSQAAIEYATERMPMEQLLGAVKAGAPFARTLLHNAALEIPGEQVATVLQDLNEWAVLPENRSKSFKQYLAERPNAAAQTLIATVIGVGGQVSIAQSIERMVGDEEQRQRAEAGADQMAKLMALAAQSRLAERSPETLAAVVQDMAEDSDGNAPTAARFDARTLAETLQQSGLDEAALAQVLPSVTAEALQQAAVTGGEVSVPIGELTRTIGTPLEQVLLQHARLGENELSQAEAKTATEQAEAFLKDQAERITRDAADAATMAASMETVKQQVRQQLDQAKRFTGDVNEAYATLVGNFYTTMAERLGVTPDALYASYPLQVQAMTPGGEVLKQGAVDLTPGVRSLTAGDTTVDYTVSGQRVEVSMVKTPEAARGQGSARRAMQALVEAADGQGLQVVLTAEPMDKATSKAKLEAFYKSLGFKTNKGRAKDFTTMAGMVREPQVLKQDNAAVDEATGLPLNADGTVTVYHHTSAAAAEQIRKTGRLKAAAEPSVYVTTVQEPTTGYGDTVVALRVKPETLLLDDEFPDGRRDFSIDAGKPGGAVRVQVDDGTLQQGPRGNFSPSTLTISLLENADLSTFLHETGHFFMVSLFAMAAQPGAPAQVQQDVERLLAWFGVKDRATWDAMTLDQQRASHERFAESFEQYLLEGKAPAADLQPLFQRFRAWLVNVYKSFTDFMKGRDLHLSDEVRAVFDRLIATDNAIQQAEALRHYAPLFASAEQAGMTPEEWAAYQVQAQAGTDAAVDELQARSLREMRWTTGARNKALKKLQKDVAAKRKAVEDEVRAEVEQQAIYQALRWLRKGEMTTPDGEQVKAERGFRLSSEALAEMYPPTALGNPDIEHLKGLTAANGLHPDLVADMFGFESGDHLVRALAEMEPMQSAIDGMTDQRLLERFGDLATEAGVQRAADAAVHNDARGRFLAAELKALQDGTADARLTATVDKAVRGTERKRTAEARAALRTSSTRVMVRAAKQFADNLVARRKVRELKAGQHTAAESRAGKQAEQALARGDAQAAAAAKRDQLLNHYAARATGEALDEVERGVAYLKRFDKDSTRKALPSEYVDQIDKLLERIELRQRTNRELDKRATLAAWVESQAALGIEVDLPDYLVEGMALVNYRDMTVESFRGLIDTVKQIEHLARLKSKLLTAKDQREFDAVVGSISSSIISNAGTRTANTRTPTTNAGRWLQKLKQFGAAHVKAATWARILDGGKDGGPVWEYVIRSANEAGDMEATMVAKATADLSAIMAPLLARAKLGGKGTHFASIGRTLNREGVLAMALNVGNESNLQRLLGGEGWSIAQVQPVLATLTTEDWHAVQAIWDYFETFRPLIAAKERRVFGKEPQWLEPGSSLLVGPALPAAAGIKGGYYPVKYDPLASQRAEEHADAEGAKRQLQGAYGAATTKRSFTKARAEEVTGRPLLYTLQGVYSGVSEVVHDLAWHEWLIDVNRLFRSKSIDSAIREHYGPEVVRQFKEWRDDIAEGDAGSSRALESALGTLRQSVSVAGLGFNVVSAMMQPLGLTQSIQRVGFAPIARGVMAAIGSPAKSSRTVNAKSAFMANRARTRFRELNELRNRVQGQTALKRAIASNAYRLMMAFQRLVDVPTWLGAYDKALHAGESEARAIALADQAVIDSQGGGQAKDLAAIERGGPALKLFTVFYSFMNTALNLGVAAKMAPGSRAKFAADMLLLYAVPAVLGSILKDALTPGDAGDDDDEKLAKKLAAQQLSYLMGLMVLGREFGAAANLIAGKPADYSGPAGLRAIQDAYTFSKQASQGEFDDAFRKAAINLGGDIFGLPSAQINRSITGVKALAEGKTSNPAAVLMGHQEPK